MYLRTPKRYRPGHRERRVFNLRWFWLWLLTPIIVVVGISAYENRARLAPPVQQALESAISGVQGGVATLNAPTPTPTENPTNRLARADESWTAGAIGQALEDYARIAPAVPNMAVVHTRIALGHVMEGRNDEAVLAAESAVTADPYSPDAWAVRALVLARDGDPEAGIASALQALSLNAADPQALAFLAEAYRLADRPSLALETADRAIEADPNRYEGYFVRAMTNYYNLGDFEGAREDFTIARDLAPTLPYIKTEMAWIEWQFSNTDLSMELLAEVVERNPQNLDALYALGFFYYQTYGDPDNAIEYLNRCVTADADNITCLAYLAIVQSADGQVNDALDTYRRLMETGTTDPRHYLRAGGLLADTGSCNQALGYLRQGYELERAAEAPNPERIAAFESYLATCQPGFAPQTLNAEPETTATAEAEGG
ncbi:MAG: tetratricopeptide repeat protein [bacterium]|nr:tetratricopeptide repeat protein [bacterium]